MKYREDLKLEFRAVPYGDTGYHVLEYRIDPNQDITYKKTFKFFCIEFNIKKKFNTNWYEASKFRNWPGLSNSSWDKSEGYLPILIRTKSDLVWYKNTFHTIGDFFKHIEKIDAKEIAGFEKEREKFLNKNKIWK
jgi:hypothetical protein